MFRPTFAVVFGGTLVAGCASPANNPVDYVPTVQDVADAGDAGLQDTADAKLADVPDCAWECETLGACGWVDGACRVVDPKDCERCVPCKQTVWKPNAECCYTQFAGSKYGTCVTCGQYGTDTWTMPKQ